MAKYHGIDWDLAEKRIESLSSFKKWIAENDHMDASIEFDKGEPTLKVKFANVQEFLTKMKT